jgi:hypothetical protein
MIEHPYMEGKTLYEKQSQFFNGHLCPYCGEQTQLIDSIKVYRESYGLIFYCERDSAWVGVHAGSDQSLGTLAKKPLRDLRHTCHLLLDPLWKKKKELTGLSTKAVRAKAYKWVSDILGIEREAAHIGFLNSDQCNKLIAECQKHYDTPEKIALRESWIKWNKDVVYWNAEEFGYEVKEFSMNGIIQMELTHRSGKVLRYNPKDRTGSWAGKKSKAKPIEDIELFIKSNFK